MDLLLTVRVALRALGKNKLRTGLTTLGVMIGVAAVILIVSLGQSARTFVQREMQNLGTNAVIVFSGSGRNGGVRGGKGSIPTLTAEDAEAIIRECGAIRAVSPLVGARAQAIFGNVNWSPEAIHGVAMDYLVVRNWNLRAGNFFSDREIHSAAKVCVLGQTVAEKLFQTTNPLGKEIRIKNIPFVVIGVLEEKGANLAGEDQDDMIFAPFTTVRSRLRGSYFDKVDVIFASARTSSLMDQARQEIEALLRERHHIRSGDPPDFEVHTTTELANQLNVMTGAMTAFLTSIAGVSLLVGGVGIMNMMLVSVTERTREIGIRMAVGARQWDILRQFLVESVLLSMLGGLIGFVLGVAAFFAITLVINTVNPGIRVPFAISLEAAAVAILCAATVGVFFGYYPARQASRLDPIEALRYE